VISDRLDAVQRRHPVLGLPIAVVYKFADDQGGYLAVIITYYAFVSVVPLLLLATSVLGFLLQGDPGLQQRVLDSAVSRFPIVGDQLGRPEGLQGSSTAVVVGAAAAVYGSLGLGTALQNALNTAWAVPRNNRPNPVLLRLRSLLRLVTGGLALVAVSAASVVARFVVGDALPVLLPVVSVVVVTGLLAAVLWLASGRRHAMRAALPGAVLTAVLWQLVQAGAAAAVVGSSAGEASAMNQTFGVVLGLVATAYAASLALLLGVELNVVLERRLWPRALLTPFTDDVDLTPGDQRAYAGYVRAQRHKGFQYVVTRFKQRD
jgi:uncharacterized BrkB/YihY/UPF0761 family membrane protein